MMEESRQFCCTGETRLQGCSMFRMFGAESREKLMFIL